MKNKVLINLYVSVIDEEYEIFIPVNESIRKVIDLIIKSIMEISDNALPMHNDYCLMDPETSVIYDFSTIVRNTNIRNNKKVVLF